ncbi:hypothetical protein ACH5RR_011270 [Cinchona calisaya]|uniref:Integrase zinc-binding domain-containing protein n=1 Tax=Cinchona calisaya TaxID=153742 RepID=A0ABD3A4H5_9GENT
MRDLNFILADDVEEIEFHDALGEQGETTGHLGQVDTQPLEKLKQALSTAPMLQLRNFTKPFVIETYASSAWIGSMLMQASYPIAYLSKGLSLRNKGLDYKIQYKKRAENKVVDAISRRFLEEINELPSTFVVAISSIKPDWMQEVLQSYDQDPECQQLIAQLVIDAHAVPLFQLSEGILKYQNMIYIGKATDLRQKIIRVLHDSFIGGHSGQKRTLQKVKSLFHWPGLGQEVDAFVQQCDTCQRNKPEHFPYPRLLQPLPIPNQAWK